MSNPDHWNSLASQLGAEVPEPVAGAEEKKPAAQPPAPPRRVAPAAAKKPAAPKPSADWSQLASQLGIEVPEPPAASQPIEARAPRQPPAAREAPEPPRHRPPPRETAEPAHGRHERVEEVQAEFIAERFGDDEPIEAELVEAELVETGEGEEGAEPSTRTEEEERTGRKRRRRRRGGRRSKRDRPTAEEGQSRPPETDLSEGQPDLARQDIENLGMADAASAEQPESESLDERDRKGRPKRRRRRGSGRNHDKDKERPTDAESKAPQSDGQDAQEALAEDDEQEDYAEMADDAGAGEDDGSENPTDKNSHRAIPAWEEAIGYIVSVNMEARAKNPKSGPPRGRGRGRGGNRGGNPRGNNRRA